MLQKGSERTTTQPHGYRSRVWLVVVFVFALVGGLVGQLPAWAQAPGAGLTDAPQTLSDVGSVSGFGSTELIPLIGNIINIVLGFVGLLLLCILIYAGYEWMTAGGDTKKVESAQLRIRNVIVGLVIVVSAFAIARFVMSMLSGVAGEGGGVSLTGQTRLNNLFPSDAGGLGTVIEYHVPMRDARDVPRNSGIAIVFKEPVLPASFIQNYRDDAPVDSYGLNTDAVRIYPTRQPDQYLHSDQVRVAFTEDKKSYVMRLVPPLLMGNSATSTLYTVELRPATGGLGGGGSNVGLRRMDGQNLFQGSPGERSGYRWQFEVSTRVDTEPPRVEAVVPAAGGQYAKNIILQIRFSEPVDPTSASGFFRSDGSGFSNIQVNTSLLSSPTSISRPAGEFRPSGDLRTVEFVPDSICGVNTCGNQIYCLPGDASISPIVKAATLSENPPTARLIRLSRASSLFDGVVDMAGNSLDGNGDGRAQGSSLDDSAAPGTDDYSWTFGTSDRISTTPPRVQSTLPRAGDRTASSFIPLDQQPQAVFEAGPASGGQEPEAGVLQASTVNSRTVFLRTREPSELSNTFWFSSQLALQNQSHVPISGVERPLYSQVALNHRMYLAPSGTTVPRYYPFFNSGLQNVYQNCFYRSASAQCSGPSCCDNQPASACSWSSTSSP